MELRAESNAHPPIISTVTDCGYPYKRKFLKEQICSEKHDQVIFEMDGEQGVKHGGGHSTLWPSSLKGSFRKHSHVKATNTHICLSLDCK